MKQLNRQTTGKLVRSLPSHWLDQIMIKTVILQISYARLLAGQNEAENGRAFCLILAPFKT